MTQSNNTVPSGMLKVLVTLACLVIVLAGVKTATNVIVPFLLSIFIAIICNPLVNLLMRFKFPRGLAITMVVVFIVILGFSLATLVGNSLNQLSALLPEYREQLKQHFTWLIEQLNQYNIQLSSAMMLESFDPGAAMGMATRMLTSLGNVLANVFLILLTVIFMLLESSSLPKKLHFAFDDPDMRLKQIDRFLSSVNHYLAIKTLVSLATGILVSVMLWAFGLDFYLLWGVLAFLLNYIPNIGSIIAAVPAMSLAVLQLGFPSAGAIGLGFMLINTIMGNVVEPRYMGRGLGLSTLVVFLSLIFWGWLLGTVGMLLSVPLTMILKIALENSSEGHWFSVLLSAEQPVTASDAENEQ
jgi:predicted PurR-regulated permease PerM